MVPWSSAGDILRWWRSDVLGLTQAQAAERLNVQSSALSNWERGTRAISIDLEELDEALKGGDVLRGLLWAVGTPRGLDPDRTWSKVFPGASRPVWLWLRSPSTQLHFEGEWGLVSMERPIELGPNGLFVTVGASVPDSPVVVHLSEPAWADFGWGELPAEMPGAPVLPAVSFFERSTADGPLMELFSSSLAAKLGSRSRDVLRLANAVPRAVFSFVTGAQRRARRATAEGSSTGADGLPPVERQRFARLRDARRLSLVEVSDRLAAETGIEVSRDTLRRFEVGVGRPHAADLPVALDHVLGGEGRLAAVAVRSGRGDGSVSFGSFWRGPVWLELSGPRQSSTVVLRRGNWHREYPLSGRAILSVHWFDPAVPLRIVAEPGVSWTVGVGRRPGAEALDQNWVPTTVDTAQEAIASVERAIFTALDRRPDDE